jgi:hypothetical protein
MNAMRLQDLAFFRGKATAPAPVHEAHDLVILTAEDEWFVAGAAGDLAELARAIACRLREAGGRPPAHEVRQRGRPLRHPGRRRAGAQLGQVARPRLRRDARRPRADRRWPALRGARRSRRCDHARASDRRIVVVSRVHLPAADPLAGSTARRAAGDRDRGDHRRAPRTPAPGAAECPNACGPRRLRTRAAARHDPR